MLVFDSLKEGGDSKYQVAFITAGGKKSAVEKFLDLFYDRESDYLKESIRPKIVVWNVNSSKVRHSLENFFNKEYLHEMIRFHEKIGITFKFETSLNLCHKTTMNLI